MGLSSRTEKYILETNRQILVLKWGLFSADKLINKEKKVLFAV